MNHGGGGGGGRGGVGEIAFKVNAYIKQNIPRERLHASCVPLILLTVVNSFMPFVIK